MENKRNAFVFELLRLLLIPLIILFGFKETAFYLWINPLAFLYCGALFIWAFKVFLKSNNNHLFKKVFKLQTK
tara:strand:- start:292 stop:510 length:219 start_codon:yes stop_codon:yes gene_type:complete